MQTPGVGRLRGNECANTSQRPGLGLPAGSPGAGSGAGAAPGPRLRSRPAPPRLCRPRSLKSAAATGERGWGGPRGCLAQPAFPSPFSAAAVLERSVGLPGARACGAEELL